MQNQKRSIWSVLAVSAFLMLLAASVIILGKMSAAQRENAKPAAAGTSASANFSGISESLPQGTTKYFSIWCEMSETSECTRFLKVVKEGDGSDSLRIYEAESLNAVQVSTTPSMNLGGNWRYDAGSASETWTISVTESGYSSVDSLRQLLSDLQSWDVVLPVGATNYYAISCKAFDGQIVKKYIKAVKTEEGLALYEADTMDGAKGAEMVTDGFLGTSVVSEETETWYLAAIDSGNYRDIMTVSPIDTIINAVQVWNGQEEEKYVDVAAGTVVRYALYASGTEDPVGEFYVKKTTEGILQVLATGDSYTNGCCVVNGGQTIHVKLKAAEKSNGVSSAEEWRITITGYEREDEQGKLIEYTVKEKDISGSQMWIHNSTEMVHTFDGVEKHEAYNVVYTLVLRGNVRENENLTDTLNVFDVLRITKTVADGNVVEVTVQGLEGKISVSTTENFMFTTVEGATLGGKTMDSSQGIITFVRDSAIMLNDIQNSAGGVTVAFQTGVDNGVAYLQLQLTESGKLSYHFTGLPADVFIADPGNIEINVESYMVETTMVSN